MRGVLGCVFVGAGLLLAPRPLSAVLVFVVCLIACGISAAVLLILQSRSGPWRWAFAVALTASAIVAALFIPAVVLVLPGVLAAALIAIAVRLLVRATAKGCTAALRVAHAFSAAACLLFAALVWIWPDVATIALGAAFALAFLGLGVVLLVRAIRAPAGLSARGAGRRRPVLRAIGAALVLAAAVAATGGSLQLRAGIAEPDDFYIWDAEVPAVPGTVLRTAPYEGELPEGAAAVRVLYATTHSDDSPALASAVIAYPRASATSSRPVLAWQHGTTGVARSCGPSVGPAALTEYAIPGISRAIERGWVVVATDYPGQGTAGRYPYLIGQGEARATLDSIRAAQQIRDAAASDSAWIWGHSQGGHATLWAGRIAPEYAPEIDVVGVAALSAASDPLTLAERITGATASALGKVVTSLVLVPYAEEYPDVDLGASVHPAGHGIVRAFASRCVAERPTLISVLMAASLSADAPLYRIDVSAGATHDRLAENVADGLVPAPLFLGQGVEDEVIPIEMQRTLSARLCEAGRTVQTREYEGRSHMGVIAEDSPLIDDLYAWADLVAEGVQPRNCPE